MAALLADAYSRSLNRPYAMGRFRDLLYASARSAAMLRYLDNISNTRFGPNENYARELMELHTLGVEGGYTEQDVAEVARCFTGWRFDGATLDFRFVPDKHDEGEKTVLGHQLPAGQGVADGEQVLEILLAHPSTARFIAGKLVRRLVADDPPETLVSRVADAFISTDGDIRSLLRTIFVSDEFRASVDARMKRPVEYVCAAVRALVPNIEDYKQRLVLYALQALGQVPFEWPTPDGYPDTADYWASAMGMTERWEFAVQLAAARAAGTSHAEALLNGANTAAGLVDQLAESVVRRPLAESARQALIQSVLAEGSQADDLLPAGGLADRAVFVVSSLLGSPYFMVR